MIMKDVATKLVNVCAYNADNYNTEGAFCKCNKCGSLMLFIDIDYNNDNEIAVCVNCKSDDIANVDNRDTVSIEELKDEGYKLKSRMVLEDCDIYFAPRKTIVSPLFAFEEILWRIFNYEDIVMEEKNSEVNFYNADDDEMSYRDVLDKIGEFLGEEVIDLHIKHETDNTGFDFETVWIEVRG